MMFIINSITIGYNTFTYLIENRLFNRTLSFISRMYYLQQQQVMYVYSMHVLFHFNMYLYSIIASTISEIWIQYSDIFCISIKFS